MKIANNLKKRVILLLIKDFSKNHTVTSIAKELEITRVGIWKILKKLEEQKLINLKSVGIGKTSTQIINLDWDQVLEKTIVLYLVEEAVKQKRWMTNFEGLQNHVEFILLYGSILYLPEQADDIDLICVVKSKKKFTLIEGILNNIQKTQVKKIHSINFTEEEFRKELETKNKAFIDAIKKGIVLYGQENFIKLIKKVKTNE